jgi:hypothetical protein
MKLPIQAQPVTRKVSTATIPKGGMAPSEDCEMQCFGKCLPIALNCGVREGDCGFSECLTNCKKIKCP